MDDQTNYNVVNENENPQQAHEETELSHTDKLVGVLSDPAATFEQTAKFPPRVIDWLMPVILVILLSIISNIILMGIPNIRYQVLNKQMKQIEKDLDEQVAKGNITRSDADARIDQTRNFMEGGPKGFMIAMQVIGNLFIIFIMFFVVSLVYFILSKFILKGEGQFSSAMVGYGLTYYIGIIGIILMAISSLALGRMIMGINPASLLDMDKTTAAGYFLGKIDVLTIWSLAIVGIGLSKMFHSKDTKKYLVAVFAVWIGWSILFFALAQAVPFLKTWLEYM